MSAFIVFLQICSESARRSAAVLGGCQQADGRRIRF